MDDKYNKMTNSFVAPALSVSLGRQSNGCYFSLVVSNGFNLLVGYWGTKEFQIVSEWFNHPGWFRWGHPNELVVLEICQAIKPYLMLLWLPPSRCELPQWPEGHERQGLWIVSFYKPEDWGR